MPIETNLNKVPYYDDYDETNNYYRILFRPSSAVQARELTQMQSIQQNQIEKFGKHIFKDGSIVDGCDLSFDNKINYLKITDNYTNGTAISTIDLEGKYLHSSTSNLYSYIVSTAEGSEGSPPDLKTLYIKYNNSGRYSNGAQQTEYNPDDVLTVYTSANVDFATLTVANSSMSPSGNGFVASLSEGTVFHKGVFIRAAAQKIVVSKYDTNPNNVTVGMSTIESIVTPEIDVALLDNAQGVRNTNAPGAHRLKLVPVLTLRTTDNTSSTNTTNFFALAEFVDGKATRILTDPQYASLGVEMARRTYEESGNYVVNPFIVTTGVRYNNNVANTTYINAFVDKGIGYIKGYRVEYSDKVNIPVRKGTDVEYVDSQTITGNFGNYVYVTELAGIFDVNNLDRVDLVNTAQGAITNGQLNNGTMTGTIIGSANIRAVMYYSGTPGKSDCIYKVYLININMLSGYSFSQVRSIYGETVGTGKAFADLTLESGIAVVKEPNLSNLVLPLGKSAVRNLRNSQDAPSDYVTQYNFRSSNNFTFSQAQSSVGTLSIPGTGVGTSGQELPYSGGTLSSTSENDFIIIATNSANTANLTGTVSTSGNVVTGIGTNFNDSSSELYLEAGDFVYVSNSTTQELRIISAVTNSTSLTVNTAFVGTFPSGAKIKRHIPAGSIINMSKPTANIIVVDTSSANVYLGTTLNKDLTATAYYNLRRETAVGISKVINKNRYVKIDMSSNTTGPWSLGLSDVHKIRGIYLGNTTVGEYSTSNKNVTNQFLFNKGQRDDRYDHAEILSTNPSAYNPTSRLLVLLDHFTHNRSSGVGFLSVESYPIDDANTSNTSAITTQEIPLFTGSNGIRLDLRDCIDFRPIKENTANSATTVNTATINPAITNTFSVASGGAYTFTPDEEFTTDFSYYLGRVDKLYIGIDGTAGVKEGIPAINTKTPADKQDSMTISTVYIPPYPSLPYNAASIYNRPDYMVNLSSQQIKRFTMKDIGNLEHRINRLEYYTTLSLLELATNQLNVLDGSGNNRFKNGFLVDSFNDVSIADTDSVEFQNYCPGFDFKNSEIAPRQAINWVNLMVQSTDIIEYFSSIYNVSASTRNLSGIPNRIHTLPYTVSELVKNPSGSRKMAVSQGTIYTYKGRMVLDPPGSHKIDVTSNPSLDIHLSTLGKVNVVNHVIIGSAYEVQDAFQNIGTNLSATVTPGEISKFSTGDYIQNISVNSYLDPILIKFKCSGLKPNTKVHPYFDNVLVSHFCQQTNSSFVATGSFGGDLTTDSTGLLYGFFFLPKGMFLVGERIFKVVDVSNLVTSSETIRSEASAIFFGSNIDITKSSLNIQSQPHDIDLISTLTKPTAIKPTVTINNIVNNVTNVTNINNTVDVNIDQQYTSLVASQLQTPTYIPQIIDPPYQQQIAYISSTDSPGGIVLTPNFNGSADTAVAFMLLGYDISDLTEIPDGWVLPDGVSSEGG